MACEILDFRCIFVSELVGNVVLTVLLATIFYFIIAGKLRWGFDTTILIAFPFLLMFGLMVAGFSAIYAFATVIIGFMLAWIFGEIIRGR